MNKQEIDRSPERIRKDIEILENLIEQTEWEKEQERQMMYEYQQSQQAAVNAELYEDEFDELDYFTGY